eukprot:7346046-Alexandrium_andersonii.AAC.1
MEKAVEELLPESRVSSRGCPHAQEEAVRRQEVPDPQCSQRGRQVCGYPAVVAGGRPDHDISWQDCG